MALKYKLINGSANDTSDVIGTVLHNRGIEDVDAYLNFDRTDGMEDWKLLDNIEAGVGLFDSHFQKRDKIAILCDNDVDGVSSATLAFKYIKDLDVTYPVEIIVHNNQKSHGLCGDFDIPSDTRLLWIPDAATNDYNECKALKQNGIDVLITDHHECSEDGWKNAHGDFAVVINNQVSENYPHKAYCGCAITREFCRALDEFYWTDYASKYDDLVAVANIADVMSLKDIATHREVAFGLSNIRNKMLLAIFDAQSFSTKGIISPFTVSFYISPLINSFIRMASADEKQVLVRAFCEDESEVFEYTKRGTTTPVQENIYEHCVRMMKSYKGKQDRLKEKGFQELVSKISKNNTDDKVIICDCTEELEQSMTGLVAIKIAEKFNRPTLLLRAKKGDTTSYGGSGRAFDFCPVEDFRGLVESCPYVSLAQGHAGAFGVEIEADKLEAAQEWLNNELADMDFSKVYFVDFELDASDVDFRLCSDVDAYKTIWGKEVEKPLFCIKGLEINNKSARICGKNNDTIQITWEDNPVKYVQFKTGEGNPLYDWLVDAWDEDATATLNIIGTLDVSSYNGVVSGQVEIKDLELVN